MGAGILNKIAFKIPVKNQPLYLHSLAKQTANNDMPVVLTLSYNDIPLVSILDNHPSSKNPISVNKIAVFTFLFTSDFQYFYL